ncbi:CD209 antigen-like protein A isoform X4 [Oculina patagonica]
MDVLTQSLVPKIVLFILLLSFATVTNSQVVCPKNWIYMEGSCYHFSSGASLNWTAAKSACEDLGSNLVVINSQAEQQAIAAKVSQRTWIGLYRNPKDKSRWLWVDGSPGQCQLQDQALFQQLRKQLHQFLRRHPFRPTVHQLQAIC